MVVNIDPKNGGAAGEIQFAASARPAIKMPGRGAGLSTAPGVGENVEKIGDKIQERTDKSAEAR
jgi:hypothetical protein